MSQSVVLVDKSGAVATVTLNRPESLNAFNQELRTTFVREMLELRNDQGVCVIIVTGAGRAFSAGLDLKEISTASLREPSNVTFISVLDDMAVPVIAAVNGYAITGGLELALACDVIIAAQGARFADTHARVGVMPGGGMSVRLPRAIGIRKAKELSLTGNFLTAEEALQMGLVNRVVPSDRLLPAARELAAQISSADQHIVRQLKRLIDRASLTTVGDGLRLEQDFFKAFNRSDYPRDFEKRRLEVQARGRQQGAPKQ
jgi:enoyl-CoA hydratase